MKAFKLCLMVLIAASFAAVLGCDDPVTSGPKDAGGDGPEDGGTDEVIVLTTECDTDKLCSALDNPIDCVADFSYGTNQAGYPGIAGTGVDGLYAPDSQYYDSDYPYVGIYSYNDYSWQTSDAEMIPVKNNTQSGPAEKLKSCAGDDDWVLHAKGNDLWTDWGVGLALDWSGENNPACYEEDGVTEDAESIACWEKFLEDDRIKLADIQKLDECDTERKIECATRSKRYKDVRDLSAYKGLGFWILTTPDNAISVIDVHFPIPATTRWESAGADGDECDNEDATDSNDCYNDFAANVNLAPDEVNKWVYKEILFKNLAQNPHWGFQFDEGTSFPPTQSIGIKFQFGNAAGPESFDFYLDDIRLIR